MLPDARQGPMNASACPLKQGVRYMDVATIAVVGLILVSYVVGSLTSSVETEQELPHRF